MTVKDFQQGSLTIASGQTTSDALVVAERGQGAFSLPAAFTGTEISFLVSDDGTNFYDLFKADGTVFGTLTASVDRSLSFPAVVFDHFAVKLVSNQAEGGSRTIPYIVKS